MNDLIMVERTEGIATVMLNRPDRLNALSKPMWPALTEAFELVSADEAVRCVVLRGAGTAFSPGADIGEFATERATPEQAAAYGKLMDRAYAAIGNCRHPILAAIQGACTGAGLVLALLCDLRIAAEGSRFGAPVSRLGLNMPASEFSVLFNVLGRVRTLELVLEARVMNAGEALAKGLINHLVPETGLDSAVRDSADRIAAGAPLVNRWHKAFARRLATGAPLAEAEIAASYASFGTADYREGYGAFLEKRRPRFEGR